MSLLFVSFLCLDPVQGENVVAVCFFVCILVQLWQLFLICFFILIFIVVQTLGVEKKTKKHKDKNNSCCFQCLCWFICFLLVAPSGDHII